HIISWRRNFILLRMISPKKVGKNRSTVANMMRLIELPHEIQVSIRKNQISVGHARPLLSLQSHSERTALWKEIIKNNLTVRDVEQIIHGGKPSKGTRSKKKKHTKNVELNDLTELLTTHLGTKVRVRGSAKKGKIEIEYYSQEDLERLIEALTGAIT
ncbi:ParB/RepB/Spo0J family partition protein, partial [Candidatus Margulisiibacteriota bacterium]